jgi:hypothetical protein
MSDTDTSPTIKLASLKQSAKADHDGVWVPLPEVPGAEVKVRPLDFPAYSIARNLLSQKLAREFGRKQIPPEVQTTRNGLLLAEHILLDWKGFDEPYSKEQAKELLGDWEWRKLNWQVVWAAGTLTDTNVEFVEDARKN